MAIVKKIKRKTRTAYQVEYREGSKRKYLSLGSSYNKREAQEIAGYVDRIVRSRLVGSEVDARRRKDRILENLRHKERRFGNM